MTTKCCQKEVLSTFTNIEVFDHSRMSKVVSDWLKSLRQKSPSRNFEKTDEEAVVNTLLSEVEMQIRATEELQRQQQMALRRRGSQVDYTWLLSSSTQKNYEIPPMEKFQLSELCTKVRPGECNGLISHFRELLTDDMDVADIARLMCNLTADSIAKREAEEEMNRTASKSILRALNLVRVSNSGRSVLSRANGGRRNSTMPTRTTDNNEEQLFLVERAFSFPLIRMDKLECQSTRIPDLSLM